MNFLFREKPLGDRHQQRKEKEKTIKKRKERPNKLSYSTNQGILHWTLILVWILIQKKTSIKQINYLIRPIKKKAPSNLTPVRAQIHTMFIQIQSHRNHPDKEEEEMKLQAHIQIEEQDHETKRRDREREEETRKCTFLVLLLNWWKALSLRV